MATALPYSYAHCWDEMQKGIDTNGPFYKVKYVFDDWSKSDGVVNALLGLTTFSGSGVPITRGVPHQHPLSPNLFCVSAIAEGASSPVLNPQGLPNYSGSYFVHCEYRPFIYTGFGDPFGAQQIDPTNPIPWATQELDFTIETIVVPDTNYKWQSDGIKCGIPIKFDVGLVIMRITFLRVPYVPTPFFRRFTNKINSATFLSAPPLTVLFAGGQTRRTFDVSGQVTQECTLTFKQRQYPWTQTLRKDKLVFDTVTDGASTYLYGSDDLNVLLSAFF